MYKSMFLRKYLKLLYNVNDLYRLQKQGFLFAGQPQFVQRHSTLSVTESTPWVRSYLHVVDIELAIIQHQFLFLIAVVSNTDELQATRLISRDTLLPPTSTITR